MTKYINIVQREYVQTKNWATKIYQLHNIYAMMIEISGFCSNVLSSIIVIIASGTDKFFALFVDQF